MSESSQSFDCIFCDQGPIYLVEIIPKQLGRFRICAECERMWREGVPMDAVHAIDFVAFMDQHNEAAVWSNLRQIND